MSNDGTGLREAELDARTIYDIACIRADASKATREDVEFKAIALRNYKAIAALSAVAPPPVLEGWVLVPREPTIAMFRGMVEWAEGGGSEEVTDEYLAANLPDFAIGYAAMLAASPAAPAQQAVTDEMVERVWGNLPAGDTPSRSDVRFALEAAIASNAAASAADAQEEA